MERVAQRAEPRLGVGVVVLGGHRGQRQLDDSTPRVVPGSLLEHPGGGQGADPFVDREPRTVGVLRTECPRPGAEGRIAVTDLDRLVLVSSRDRSRGGPAEQPLEIGKVLAGDVVPRDLGQRDDQDPPHRRRDCSPGGGGRQRAEAAHGQEERGDRRSSCPAPPRQGTTGVMGSPAPGAGRRRRLRRCRTGRRRCG